MQVGQKLDVMFKVAVETRGIEVACVTGDCKELGNWNPNKAIILKKISNENNRDLWARTVKLPISEVHYRYFVGLVKETSHEEEDPDIIVQRWETNIKPRKFSPMSTSDDNERGAATFGFYGGLSNVTKGWLSGQTEVRIRLTGSPINMWKSKHRDQTYRVKCSVMDLRYRDQSFSVDDDEDSRDVDIGVPPSSVNIQTAVMSKSQQSAVFTEQSQNGHTYFNGDLWSLRHKHLNLSSCLAAMRENTVGSLTAAGSHGADMVEFDVQLTKDLVPVLYHDFNVCLTMRKKKKEDLQLFQVPVKDLTNAQLQSLKLDHVSMQKYSNIDLTTEESNPPEEQPSPELTRLFESLDPLLGFCIELKYPQRYMNGTHEMDHYFDPNLYLDIILEQILKLAGERRIILCCFHPDICAMASIKQNKYPVFFLTCGVNSLWDTYVDIRTHSFPIAVNFAKADGILGISAHAEELLNDQSLIDIAKAEKKVVISWGEQLNNRETLDKLKDKGIDGLIYDRIYDLKTDKSNVFKLEYEAKLKLLQDLGQIPNTKHAQRQLLGSTSSEPGDNKEDTSSSAESSRSSSPTDKKRPLVVSSDTTLTKAKLPRQMSCI